ELLGLPQKLPEIAPRKVVTYLPQFLGSGAGVAGDAVMPLLVKLRRHLIESVRDVLQKGGGLLLALCREALDLCVGFVSTLLTLSLQRCPSLRWRGRFRPGWLR